MNDAEAGVAPVATARALQERVARAQPAQHVEVVDGWWLRHAPGCAWWVGTVLPHSDSDGDGNRGDLARRVATAEEFYRRRDEVTRIQICPPACPDGLDAVLAERGYVAEGFVSMQVASTALVRERTPAPSVRLRMRLDRRPTRQWFDVWCAVHGPDAPDPRAEWEMLLRAEAGLEPPDDQATAYASAMVGDEVIAVGRAVADSGWAGVFGMATLPSARRTGAARAVLSALADWADERGVDNMYLQVVQSNAPARRLYEESGFSELCGYHYRSESEASEAPAPGP